MLLTEAKKGDINEVSKLVLLGADTQYKNDVSASFSISSGSSIIKF